MTTGLSKSALGAVLALLVTAGVTSARSWGFHKSSMKSTTIDINEKARLGDSLTLDPGSYKIQYDPSSPSPEVVFYKDGKEVGRTQAKTVNETEKNSHTEVSVNRAGPLAVLMEIRPAGVKEKLEFGGQSGTSR
ncbi:MAG: hypothetical protein ACE145_02670 [Terriglobia bacterium]